MDATVEMFNMMQQWFQITQEHLATQDRKMDMLLQMMQKQTILNVSNTNSANAANVGERAEVGAVAAGTEIQQKDGG